MADVPADVLSLVPKQEAMQQSIRYTRRCNIPSNPRMLEELEDIPDQYQRTLQGGVILNVRQPTDGSRGPDTNFCYKKILNCCAEVVPVSSMEPSKSVRLYFPSSLQ